jgi:hypothetical protein
MNGSFNVNALLPEYMGITSQAQKATVLRKRYKAMLEVHTN